MATGGRSSPRPAPVGTGIELSGASFNTVRNNAVDHNDSWGIVVHEYPDTETPPSSGISDCQGGNPPPPNSSSFCDFPAMGNVITGNKLSDNGANGNPSNGDLADQPATARQALLLRAEICRRQGRLV